jgi:hypothetical protein
MFRKRKDKFPMHLQQVYMSYMTFVIESAIKNMKNGAEQWIWVLDLSGRGVLRVLLVLRFEAVLSPVLCCVSYSLALLTSHVVSLLVWLLSAVSGSSSAISVT